MQIYESCVLPKLLYGLESLWLRKSERQRVDALQARCLRRVMGIAHSFISRVSNMSVLQQAGRQPLTQELLRRQLLLFGRIAMLDDDSPRRVLFEPSSVNLIISKLRRGRGSPHQQWARCVHQLAVQAAGSEEDLFMLLVIQRSIKEWSAICKSFAEHGGQADDGEVLSE